MPTHRKPRVWCEEIEVGSHSLAADPAHYLRDVLRLEPGAAIEMFDGRGCRGAAQVTEISRRGVMIDVQSVERVERWPLDLTLGIATPKGDRADWVTEKLTEVGVTSIAWLSCERSGPHGKTRREGRLQRIMQAAAGQSQSAYLPTMQWVTLEEFLAVEAHHRLILDPRGSAGQWPQGPDTTVRIAVGPEGGFTEEELRSADRAGYSAVSLGPQVMRVETAAIAAAAAVVAHAWQG